MRSKITLQMPNGKKSAQYEFESTIDDFDLYEQRARDLANILEFDKNNYNDVNIETIFRACEMAGIIEELGLREGE